MILASQVSLIIILTISGTRIQDYQAFIHMNSIRMILVPATKYSNSLLQLEQIRAQQQLLFHVRYLHRQFIWIMGVQKLTLWVDFMIQ